MKESQVFLDCNSFGCLLKRNNGISFAGAKIAVGFINIIVAIIFECILYNYTATSATKHHFKRVSFKNTIPHSGFLGQHSHNNSCSYRIHLPFHAQSALVNWHAHAMVLFVQLWPICCFVHW